MILSLRSDLDPEVNAVRTHARLECRMDQIKSNQRTASISGQIVGGEYVGEIAYSDFDKGQNGHCSRQAESNSYSLCKCLQSNRNKELASIRRRPSKRVT